MLLQPRVQKKGLGSSKEVLSTAPGSRNFAGDVLSWVCQRIAIECSWFGYGSIPIHTIFRGMNIHLPAILMFTRGIGFWPIPISCKHKRFQVEVTKYVEGWKGTMFDVRLPGDGFCSYRIQSGCARWIWWVHELVTSGGGHRSKTHHNTPADSVVSWSAGSNFCKLRRHSAFNGMSKS